METTINVFLKAACRSLWPSFLNTEVDEHVPSVKLTRTSFSPFKRRVALIARCVVSRFEGGAAAHEQ